MTEETARRRKIAGLKPDTLLPRGFISKYWFQLVVIAFLTVIVFQLDTIEKEVRDLYFAIDK